MKKSLLLGILSLTAGTITSFGQGFIALDNYQSHSDAGGPLITYGAGSGGAVGTGLLAGWTAGLYFAVGNVAGDASAGNGLVAGALGLGTGAGSTAAFFTTTFGTPGEESAANYFSATGSTVGGTVTVEVVAYNGSSYATSADRGHSAAFTMTTVAQTATTPTFTGDFMPAGFSVTPVPEPTTLALAGLGGLASLVAFRRKKA
jgi:hypothetical protein